MASKRLKSSLNDHTHLTVMAELAGGPGFKTGPIETFLGAVQEAGSASFPQGYDFAGVALPQSPGGVANIEPTDALSKLSRKKLLEGLDVIPHITCKDQNVNAITSSLVGLMSNGVESVLALTGDKPVGAKGVFELEAVNLLDLIQHLNRQSMLKAKPDQWDEVPQFFAGAAVSPFKYTEASQMQQYYKMEKKIAAGAAFLITQLGWDWRKSSELMCYLRDSDITVPVIGNVYLLTTKTPAPRLMHTGKLPGCFVSDELLAKLKSESFDEHVERAAQQVAMYKDLGVAGVDIGGTTDYATFVRILERATEIGADWTKYKDNLCWPRADGFYLYDETQNRVKLSTPKRKFKQRQFNLIHRSLFDRDHLGSHLLKGFMRSIKADQPDSIGGKWFGSMEKSIKHLAFNCEDCGDCYLTENYGYCSMGGCQKGLSNAPCGDSTADGYCGNDLNSRCTGELIYEAAATDPQGREQLRTRIHCPRNPCLTKSSSWANYLFDRDHARNRALLTLGDAINAAVPNTGAALKALNGLGKDAFAQESGALNYIKALIQSQVDGHADYITLNLDALDTSGKLATKLIVPCVDLIRTWGRSVPVCLDSRHTEVLLAGLKAWFDTKQSVQPPLIRWTDHAQISSLLQLKEDYDFKVCASILNDEMDENRRSLDWIEKLHARAHSIYELATQQYAFKPNDVIVECQVLALASEPVDLPAKPSHTHIIFHALQRIMQDKHLKQIHCCLAVNDATTKLPGRKIGVCRAYVAAAMGYGMNACVADAQRAYGETPADAQLTALVNAYAQMDGSQDKARQAKGLMDKFCSATAKPKAKAKVPAAPAEPKEAAIPVKEIKPAAKTEEAQVSKG
jgi:methylenetetrahydrofolate reductase (NADPH)